LFLVDPDGKQDAFKAFQGYYKNSAATQKKIARNVLQKGDFFFRTGDVIKCVFDGPRKYTLFEDRIGDTFRWKGENVSTMVPYPFPSLLAPCAPCIAFLYCGLVLT